VLDNASIFNFSILSDWKVNIVSALGIFKNAKKNKKQIKEKREILRKIGF